VATFGWLTNRTMIYWSGFLAGMDPSDFPLAAPGDVACPQSGNVARGCCRSRGATSPV